MFILPGGYVAFTVDVPAATHNGPRELFVLADNRFNSTTAPTHTGLHPNLGLLGLDIY